MPCLNGGQRSMTNSSWNARNQTTSDLQRLIEDNGGQAPGLGGGDRRLEALLVAGFREQIFGLVRVLWVKPRRLVRRQGKLAANRPW
jgi:hypothetical protein